MLPIEKLAVMIGVPIIIGITACSTTGSTRIAEGTSPTLNAVTVGQLSESDISNNQFSLIADFTPNTSMSQWKIGFALPRVLKVIAEINYNTQLDVQICRVESPVNCSKLAYQKAPFSAPDLSTGWISIYAAESNNFPLRANTRYQLKLAHISIPALNYSSVPQSWFIIDDANRVTTMSLAGDNYVFSDYQAESIQQLIIRDQQQNWNTSALYRQGLPLVPFPESYQLGHGRGVNFSNQSIVISGGDSRFNRQLLREYLLKDLPLNSQNITLADSGTSNDLAIEIISDKSLINPEGYRLQIRDNKIELTAATSAGIFYAIQSLRQLIAYYGSNLPALTINDAPRFKYRGVMLDSVRHYSTAAEIKQLIDVMAAQKLNTLHWHLSDDEAWRLEIPNYPQLTTIGAVSGYGLPLTNMRLVDKNLDITASDPASRFLSVTSKNAGSYSPAVVKELISYANARQITIIPEIDIPGHSRAMMKALPQAFYDPEDKSAYGGYGDDVLPICSYNDGTVLGKNFTRDINTIVAYIAKAFSGQSTIYAVANEVSIGGDEVNAKALALSPSCQNSPQWSKLTAVQKEHKFFQLLAQSPQLQPLKISGWEEFLLDSAGAANGKLDPYKNVVPASQVGHVWIWQKKEPGDNESTFARNLAANNYPTVIDYSNYVYFDIRYSLDKREPGLHWTLNRMNGNETGGYSDSYSGLSLSRAMNATVKPLTASQAANIHGVEGALWADVIPNYEHLMYMAFPKMTALAEVAWSPAAITDVNGAPNWQSLATRLGCGKGGFLYYLASKYNIKYRGYPDGIIKEAPQACALGQ